MKMERRLAVIDTHFPWKLSGFRYWENMKIYQKQPNTLFFAVYPYVDDFPAKVHHFAEFTSISKSENITDVYCVFLNLALSLLGHCYLPNGKHMPGSNPSLNIKSFLESENIKLHTTLYPGGGLDPATPQEFLNIVEEHASTIFTNIEEVLQAIPGSMYIPGVINTDFYCFSPKPDVRPIQLTYCAHNAVRKGFPILAQAFNRLDESFHLNIIGSWQDHLHLLTNQNYTFFGELNPERIKPIYEESHVFINCGFKDQFALDGFPTTAAGDAMSTGCLLVATNPRNDRFLLESGKDYLEIGVNSVQDLIDTLYWIRDNFQEAMQIGVNGANKIRAHYDTKLVVENKLMKIFGK